MKVKTSGLTGAALDWAVKLALGLEGPLTHDDYYSTDWSQGGPIIDREQITIVSPCGKGVRRMAKDGTPLWLASNYSSDSYGLSEVGPTALVAAMRCFVASRLGDTVEIPEELL